MLRTLPPRQIRLLTVAIACAFLGACATEPAEPQRPTPKPGSGAASQAAAATKAPESAASAGASTSLGERDIHATLQSVRDLLNAGQEDQAVAELQKVLAAEPQQKTAQSFMRQIREDATGLLGRESFSYKVQSGDVLATIAQRFLNDRDLFYALAKYNGLKVPRQLQLGQVIRVPGKQPPAPQPPAKASRNTPAEPQVSEPAATPVSPPAPALVATDNPAEAAKRERERQAGITRYAREARTAMAKQDVCGAIAAWSEVLKLDIEHRTARLEREKAYELKKRLPASKC